MKKAVISMFIWWLILTIIIRDTEFSMAVLLGVIIAIMSIAVFDKD